MNLFVYRLNRNRYDNDCDFNHYIQFCISMIVTSILCEVLHCSDEVCIAICYV